MKNLLTSLIFGVLLGFSAPAFADTSACSTKGNLNDALAFLQANSIPTSAIVEYTDPVIINNTIQILLASVGTLPFKAEDVKTILIVTRPRDGAHVMFLYDKDGCYIAAGSIPDTVFEDISRQANNGPSA